MSEHCHTLKTEELSVVVGDNTAMGEHEAGYHGIWKITSIHNDRPVHVPRFAGMNLNHISPSVEGDTLEPRRCPVEMTVDKPANLVTLHQPTTRTLKVESWATFQVAGLCKSAGFFHRRVATFNHFRFTHI